MMRLLERLRGRWFYGASLRYWPPDEESSKGSYSIVVPDGPDVYVYRSDLEGQWCVSINTEKLMDQDPGSHDKQGIPYMLVSVNGGDVWERQRVQRRVRR